MEIDIRSLSSQDDNEIYEKIAKLFVKMHKQFYKLNLSHRLIDGGELLWINTIKKSLGKLHFIKIVSVNNEIIGFAAGNIRLLPNYLGQKKIGYISFIYIEDNYKDQGLGSKLAIELEKKLSEELNEYLENKSVEELADIVEIINRILSLKNISLEDFEKIKRDKFTKNGGFEKNLFLIDTI